MTLKYLVRPKDSWYEDGYIEWSPGRNKWYPLSQVQIQPDDMRTKFIFKILPKLWEKDRKPIFVDAYYSQIEKILVIKRIYSCQEIDESAKRIFNELQLKEEMIMYAEDMFIELGI